ncbi:MAG TPA: PQQ-binding-like beta-propeller repeat protein [Pyrinomonadaceae bacterium]|jgi:outer membrane protein assembly factor BamB|nr:PQQ-binding-like beta-propeller repeat protein [Pyrinomonadaceae bacterium]
MNKHSNGKLARARSSRTHAALIAFALLACGLLAQTAGAQDWTQWRGPARDGVVPAKNTPASWPKSLQRVWRVEIGEGYSSPIVAGGRAFVHSRRDPEEIVTAVNLADGKIIWQQKYPAPFQKNQYAVKMAKGPNATPLVAGARLFTIGATGILTAWDSATGRRLWGKDFSQTVDTSKLFCGTAASPLLSGGLLVIQVGSDVHGGQVLALDPATGATKWEWRGAGPGYASPVVFNVAGGEQIATMTNSSVVGLDAKTGRELWSVPFPDDWHENITTPVWTGAHLVVSGTRQGTHAYALRQDAGKWQATEAWKNADVTMYMSSPVYGDGLLYGHSVKRKGQFVALDAKTGAVRWITEGREGEHASVLLTPRHLLYLTNGADLIVARRAAATFEAVERYDVADAETYAMPVLLGTDLYVRDATGLSRLALAP